VALNAKRTRFVAEYLKDLNGTQAAIRAGYSKKTAYSQADELLKIPEVRKYLDQQQAKLAEKHGVTVDKIVGELSRIAFSDIRNSVAWRSNVTEMGQDEETGEPILNITNQIELIDSDKIDDATAAAISEIGRDSRGGLKIKFHDKRAALVDLGKHLGMFREKIDLTVTDDFAAQLIKARERAGKKS
jgi:phage terminase small subunit